MATQGMELNYAAELRNQGKWVYVLVERPSGLRQNLFTGEHYVSGGWMGPIQRVRDSYILLS